MPNKDLVTIPIRSLPLHRCNELPKKPGIYFALDSAGYCRYIGKAENLRNRWRNHHMHDRLSRLGHVRLHYRTMPKCRLKFEEARAIRWWSPDLNTQRPDPAKYWNIAIAIDDFVVSLGWGAIGFVGFVVLVRALVG